MSVAGTTVGFMAITGFRRGAEAAASAVVALDDSQRAVLLLATDASAAVIGAPGSGKTTTLVELVADRVARSGWGADSVLALASSRIAATRLRDVIALRIGVPTTGPMARTANSFAFDIVREAARSARVAPRRLLTGGEQDSDIAAILEGHLELVGSGPEWPPSLPPEVRRLRQFRTELRELMMRATEFDVSPGELRRLGATSQRPEWVAAAAFIEEYLEVISFSREAQVDPAELARFAVAAIVSATPGQRVSALKLVVIDDLQEATESTLAMLRALASRGIAIIAFGDPDVAANAFRGGEPDALGRLSTVLRLPSLQQLVLSTAHRQTPALRAFTSSVTARIGTAAAGQQRRAESLPTTAGSVSDPALSQIEASSPARQWSAVARVLRERHLESKVAWNDMAVIVRSGAQVAAIARALALAEVPTRTAVGGTALRDDNAARALLTVVDVGVGRTPLTAELATELLLGPFGGLDRLGLRRLRLALRAEELAGGGTRSADALLVEGLAGPNRFITIDHRMARAAGRLAETLDLLSSGISSIEELLWTAWDRSGLATTWYDQALGAGIGAAEANRNLDGIVALFTAAKRFAERRPDAPPGIFLTEVLDAEVPEDTLSPQPNDDTVLVTTASGTVGLEFDTVVVAALQDGAWPNLRLRGSLLGAQELVELVTGVDPSTIDKRKQVLGDELRMFALAVSRARSRVILSAVVNDDEAASAFFGLLPDDAALLDSSAAPPLSLRGMTGRLRNVLATSRNSRAVADAACCLAALALEGVPGAEPAHWHGLLAASTDGHLFDGQTIPVSPSALEKITESPLDWFLQLIAGSESNVTANVGTIVHWAMETSADQSPEALWTAVQSRWKELLFDAPWLAERQSRIARTLTDALAEYLAKFSRDGKQLVGAESRFTLAFDGIEMNGSIDRVERAADGSVVIVDLKTGAPITAQSKIDEHPQLSAYQLAYADGILDGSLAQLGEHSAGGAKLLFVKEGKDGRLYREGVQAALSVDQLAAFRERIVLAATIIASAQFEGPAELAGFGVGDVGRLRLHRVRAVSSE